MRMYPSLKQENDDGVSGRLILSELRLIGLKNSIPPCSDHLNILKLSPSLGSHSSRTFVLSTPTMYV